MFLRRLATVLIASLLSFSAFAGEARLTWTPPTQRVDGTPYTNYGGFKIYYGLEGQPLDTVIDIPDTTHSITTYTIENLADGTWNFSMTAYDATGLESAKTNPVSKTIVNASPPLPPSPTFVTTETTVFNVVKRDDGFVLVAVGTVPLNTPCDINQTVNGKYAVPVSTVTWLGTVKPIVVVATCSEN